MRVLPTEVGRFVQAATFGTIGDYAESPTAGMLPIVVSGQEQVMTADAKREVRIEIRLLGGFRVLVGGQEVPSSAWRLRKARSIVKLLALAPRRQIGQEELIDTFWPDLDPDAALNNFHRTLHAARAALGSRDAIRLQDGVLSLPGDDGVWIDVVAFDVAAEDARRTRTIAAYQQAIDAYIGDLLPEDPYEDWASAPREHLRTTLVALLIEQATLHNEHERHSDALPLYRRVLEIDPVHEDALRGLMRAHAQLGQQHEALATFERVEALLRDEYDAFPSPMTLTLRDAIAAGSFPDEAKQPTISRRAIIIPAELSRIVGRDRDEQEVARLLREARLVTIVGPGGAGKTRIAIRLAHRWATDAVTRDGVAFVPLDALGNPDLVPGTIVRVLDLPEREGLDPEQTVIELLRDAEMLLVLDNLEHLLDASPFIARLIDGCPGVTVLATSRERLRLAAEHEYPLPPLTLPVTSAADLATNPAIQLFLDRARASLPDFMPDSDDLDAIAEICRRLDGLPLAIELAAARVNVLPPSAMLSRASGPFALVSDGPRDRPRRQRTMQATIAWSYDLLDIEVQVAFRRAAIFAGGFEIEMAEAVLCATGWGSDDILPIIALLVERNLLRRDNTSSSSSPRFTMLETIREFGLHVLDQAGERETVALAHARAIAELTEQAARESTGPHQSAWLGRIEREQGNIRAALTWALSPRVDIDAGTREREIEPGLRIAGNAWRFWYTRGHFAEGRQWLDLALERSRGLTTAARVAVLHGAGVLAQAQGDYRRADALLLEGLALARKLNDTEGIILTLNHLGVVLRDQGDLDGAVKRIEEALALARESDHHWGIAFALNNLGLIAQRQRDYIRSGQLLEESLRRFRAIGDAWGAMLPLNNLGQVLLDQGDLEHAEAVLHETLSLYERMADTRNIAITLTKLALVAERRDDLTEARQLNRRSIRLRQAIGDREGVVTAIERLGGVAAKVGEARHAAMLIGAASTIRESIGSTLSPQEHHAHEQIHAIAADNIGENAWNTSYAYGRLLSLDRAIDIAMTGQPNEPSSKPER